LDLQDWLLMAGVAFFEGAAFVIWRPAVLILAGLFCFLFVFLIERSRNDKHGTSKP
jgi:chromate transport protein ChrA